MQKDFYLKKKITNIDTGMILVICHPALIKLSCFLKEASKIKQAEDVSSMICIGNLYKLHGGNFSLLPNIEEHSIQ